MFTIKHVDISDFSGIVPKFKTNDLNIQKIRNGFHNSSNPKIQIKPQEHAKKVLRSTKDLFDSIERRFNKFKYAFYNKGVDNMNIEKINKCYKKSRLFLTKLRQVYNKLLATHDPRADRFGKKLEEVEVTVKKYGTYVKRLNESKCAKPKTKINGNSKKIRG